MLHMTVADICDWEVVVHYIKRRRVLLFKTRKLNRTYSSNTIRVVNEHFVIYTFYHGPHRNSNRDLT